MTSLVGLLWRRARPRDGAACVLTFRGETLRGVRGRPPEGIELSVGCHWTALATLFGPEVKPLLGALMERGEGFHAHVRMAAGDLLALEGQVSGLCALLSLRHATPGEGVLHARLEELASFATVRLRAERCPVAMIELDAGGNVRWSNAAAAPLLGAAFPGSDGQLLLRNPDGAALGWHAITSVPLPGGARLLYLENIQARVASEQALQGLLATLADTFAHLGEGLAIFDRERRLSLFNPALAEIFGLDAAGLAARPSLREFLAALRDRRMIPEPASFTEWRDKLIAATSSVTGTPHTEDWSLPSGHTLRLTVRPHPDGAAAFVFEDISRDVALERRYRREMEQGQTTLDRLSEAVAIFGPSGRLVLANPAFCDLTGHGGLADLAGSPIGAVLERAEAHLGPAPAWEECRSFALDPGRPDRWDSVLPTRTGGYLMRASALPDGSTLLCLSSVSAAESAASPVTARATLSRAS
ncbi:PAS domain-containing protein [Halovulum dunhuangense]|uniref:PAS domain-containing protein n=1 Tax=Halovulum dunhuangense TaxID=1505036 RepID=A0A849L053_9RHOB|nr:PAS domain-containing protein [Halovulum dunhuangense]NNU79210.1 PAS domain-containing protein [Halovulum dunhuangense]